MIGMNLSQKSQETRMENTLPLAYNIASHTQHYSYIAAFCVTYKFGVLLQCRNNVVYGWQCYMQVAMYFPFLFPGFFETDSYQSFLFPGFFETDSYQSYITFIFKMFFNYLLLLLFFFLFFFFFLSKSLNSNN